MNKVQQQLDFRRVKISQDFLSRQEFYIYKKLEINTLKQELQQVDLKNVSM